MFAMIYAGRLDDVDVGIDNQHRCADPVARKAGGRGAALDLDARDVHGIGTVAKDLDRVRRGHGEHVGLVQCQRMGPDLEVDLLDVEQFVVAVRRGSQVQRGDANPQDVGIRSAVEEIAGAPGHLVVARLPLDAIGAAAAVEVVGAHTTPDGVVAQAAIDNVVAVKADDEIFCVGARESLGKRSTEDGIAGYYCADAGEAGRRTVDRCAGTVQRLRATPRQALEGEGINPLEHAQGPAVRIDEKVIRQDEIRLDDSQVREPLTCKKQRLAGSATRQIRRYVVDLRVATTGERDVVIGDDRFTIGAQRANQFDILDVSRVIGIYLADLPKMKCHLSLPALWLCITSPEQPRRANYSPRPELLPRGEEKTNGWRFFRRVCLECTEKTLRKDVQNTRPARHRERPPGCRALAASPRSANRRSWRVRSGRTGAAPCPGRERT